MGHVAVIIFDSAEQAGQARATMKELERQGLISLDDAAVIVKDEDGNVTVRDELDRPVAKGAVVGGFIGLLLGSIFFPITGLAIGALGGALVGKSLDRGIDQNFIREVTEALTPGTSALFAFLRQADPTAALAALKPYSGRVYHSSLSPSVEQELERLLKDRQ